MGFNSNYFINTNNIFNLKLKPNQSTILSYLIRMTNNSNSCYPSMNKISEMCCVSKSTVSKTIEELSAAGLIRVDTNKKYNVYFINYNVIETANNRLNNKVISSTKNVKAKVEKEDLDKTAEEQVVQTAKCSIEDARNAIRIAQSNNANNKVKYAIGVIRNQKNNTVDVYKSNAFHNFPQRNYSKEEFSRIERLLLQQSYFGKQKIMSK